MADNITSNVSACEPPEQARNIPMAIGYALHGALYVPLYIPCLIVICRQPLIKDSCYKIMAMMGFCDMLALVINCFAPAAMSAVGMPWCNSERMLIARYVGSAALG